MGGMAEELGNRRGLRADVFTGIGQAARVAQPQAANLPQGVEPGSSLPPFCRDRSWR